MARLLAGTAVAGLLGLLGCSSDSKGVCGGGVPNGFVSCQCSNTCGNTFAQDSGTQDAGPDAVPRFGDAAPDEGGAQRD